MCTTALSTAVFKYKTLESNMDRPLFPFRAYTLDIAGSLMEVNPDFISLHLFKDKWQTTFTGQCKTEKLAYFFNRLVYLH